LERCPSGGGASQTALNRSTGARTQAAELVTAAMAVATMLFLAPVLGPMPNATLAAIVIAYSVGLISPRDIEAIRRIRTIEFRWVIAACIGVMVLGTLKGISSRCCSRWQASCTRRTIRRSTCSDASAARMCFARERPSIRTMRPWPGLVIARTEGRMYFGNAPVIGEKLRALIEAQNPGVVVLDCSAIPGFEYTALNMLIEAESRLRDEGVELWLAALNPEALELLRRTPLAERLGRERMFFTVEAAVDAYEKRGAA
jgi:MFS superfamily sulfate permease-like transporter